MGGSKSAIPELLRREVTRRGGELVARKFSPLVDPDRASSHGFNYPFAVFTEWRGRAFHLCVRYRTPRGRTPEDFVTLGRVRAPTNPGRSSARGYSGLQYGGGSLRRHRWRDCSRANARRLHASSCSRGGVSAATGCCASLHDHRPALRVRRYSTQTVFTPVSQN
jgi:hypothetical protein